MATAQSDKNEDKKEDETKEEETKESRSENYVQLTNLLNDYYAKLSQNQTTGAKTVQEKIRSFILANGCPEDDFHIDIDVENDSHSKKILKIWSRKHLRVKDTLRGRLWRAMLGVPKYNENDYIKLINEKECIQYYVRIRGDSKRTFASSEEFMSVVGEEVLVRVLNSFSNKTGRAYLGGMNNLAVMYVFFVSE